MWGIMKYLYQDIVKTYQDYFFSFFSDIIIVLCFFAGRDVMYHLLSQIAETYPVEI